MNRRHLLAALAGTFAAAACTETKPQFAGVDVTGADYAKDFRLPDTDGKVRTLADFKGKIVAVFFGYTQCPDACPTTMAELAEARKLLGPQGDKLQVLFVTVDPERDTDAVLADYAKAFSPQVVGLRGSPNQLADIARTYRVAYEVTKGPPYEVTHSNAVFFFDRGGRGRLVTTDTTDTAAMAEDVKRLLQ